MRYSPPLSITIIMRFLPVGDMGIILSYAVEYWWAYLGGIAIIALLAWLYRRLKPASQLTLSRRWSTCAARTAILLAMALRSMPAAAWLIDSGVPRKLNVPRMSMNAVRLMASSMAVRMLMLNLADIPFFAFQGSRMRFSSLRDMWSLFQFQTKVVIIISRGS